MSEVVFPCPYCGDKESHSHLHVNAEKKLFYCFLCGEGGTTDRLVREYPEMETQLLVLGVLTGGNSPSPTQAREFYSVFEESVGGRRAVAYLRRRGMTEEEIRGCGCLLSPQIPYYVIFPHAGGPENFWAARSYVDELRPRWLFPGKGETRLAKSDTVWGLNRQMRDGEIWLCEGVFDALAVSGVAFYGKVVSGRQLGIVWAYSPKRLVVAFDRDARKEAEELQRKLRGVIPTAVCLPEKPYRDYGEKLAAGWRRDV